MADISTTTAAAAAASKCPCVNCQCVEQCKGNDGCCQCICTCVSCDGSSCQCEEDKCTNGCCTAAKCSCNGKSFYTFTVSMYYISFIQ